MCERVIYIQMQYMQIHRMIWKLRRILDVLCFQAEDGIRDLVRSRGLGDVYKRQVTPRSSPVVAAGSIRGFDPGRRDITVKVGHEARSVSYTHLTLPTSDLV